MNGAALPKPRAAAAAAPRRKPTAAWYVRRAAPCRFGWYSAVAVRYPLLPDGKRAGAIAWPGKETVTFPDAVVGVRRRVWAGGACPQAEVVGAIAELPGKVRALLRAGPGPVNCPSRG